MDSPHFLLLFSFLVQLLGKDFLVFYTLHFLFSPGARWRSPGWVWKGRRKGDYTGYIRSVVFFGGVPCYKA